MSTNMKLVTLFAAAAVVRFLPDCRHVPDCPPPEPDVVVVPPFLLTDAGDDVDDARRKGDPATVACAVLAHFGCGIGKRADCAEALRDIHRTTPQLGIDPACIARQGSVAGLHKCGACTDLP